MALLADLAANKGRKRRFRQRDHSAVAPDCLTRALQRATSWFT